MIKTLLLILFALIGGVLIGIFDLIIYKCCNIDLRLPALLGMLVVGIFLTNIPYNMHEMEQSDIRVLAIQFYQD